MFGTAVKKFWFRLSFLFFIQIAETRGNIVVDGVASFFGQPCTRRGCCERS
jgi:hypothetical protein